MVSSGQNITSISGIIRTGDYSLRVVTDELDVRTLYYLGSVYIAPLHYYGSTDLYNGVDSFGFAKCDLTDIRTRNEQPLGAGPYCLTAYQKRKHLLYGQPRLLSGSAEDRPAGSIHRT